MDIKRSGSQPADKGPAEYFTGTVHVDPLFQANDPARAICASVTFEPGARTAWHSHPLGQTLIVTAGCRLYKAGTVLSRKSGLVMRSGSRLERSNGNGSYGNSSYGNSSYGNSSHDSYRHSGTA